MVPAGPALHGRPRVAARRRRRGRRSGSPSIAAVELGDVVFVELPAVGRALSRAQTFGVIESVKAVSDLYARRRRNHRRQRALGRQARAGQRRSVRRGLDDPRSGSPTRRQLDGLRDADALQPLTRPGSGGLRPSYRGRPGSGCSARSASARSTNSSPTFRRPFAPTPCELPPAEPELTLATRLRGARRAQPGGPGQLPRRRRVPPLTSRRLSTSSSPGRVLHRLHAVPAGDEPGHAADIYEY